MPDVTASSLIQMTNKILVTGAAGLLGNELVKQLLEKDYKVTAVWHSTTA